MHRALHILLLIAVFLCGVHPGEPAQAQSDPDHFLLHMEAHPSDAIDYDGHSETDKAAHAGHQHCPLAADQNGPSLACRAPHNSALLFVRPVAALASLTRAPPVEPPSA